MDGQLPAAGWYADPSDPQGERWWDNTQWTDHTRPLAALPAPVPAPAVTVAAIEPDPIPQFAGAVAAASSPHLSTAGGIPQFASVVEPTWSQAAVSAPEIQYGGGNSGFTFGNDFASGQAASFDPYASSAPSGESAPAWYGQNSAAAYLPTPTNGPAIAGLVMSLVGVSLGGLIASIIGLRRARGFEADGLPPVGRLPARWGLGLSIASMALGLLATAAWIVALTVYGTTLYNLPVTTGDDTVIVTEDGFGTEDDFFTDDGVTTEGETVPESTEGGDTPVTQAQLEELATQQVIDSFDETPVSMDCPSLTPDEEGMYNCTATMADNSVITVGFNIF